MISRESIDVLKSTFRDDVCVPSHPLGRVTAHALTCILPHRSSKSEWMLIAKYLKPLLDI